MKRIVGRYFNRKVDQLIAWAESIEPDVTINQDYLHRWWIAKNLKDHDTAVYPDPRAHTAIVRFFNTYLHKVSVSDDERALHDHPWFNVSIILRGSYIEVFSDRRVLRLPGSIIFRSGTTAHRLIVNEGPVWSLFITGPKYREWGFRTAGGWMHWKEFTGFESRGEATILQESPCEET